MNREGNILDDLAIFTRSKHVDEMYRTIMSDKYVKPANYSFLPSDVQLFFVLFKQGVEYSYTTYGEGSLASGGFHLYSYFVDEHQHILTDHISYNPNGDQIQMSFLHLAGQCAHYGSSAFIIDSHLPNVRLGAEAHTVLQAIEECYHRYQIRHLGYPPVPTAESMKYEQEITPVWQRAISDLNELPAFSEIRPA